MAGASRHVAFLKLPTWAQFCLVMLGIVLVVGAVSEADRVWALHLRPRRDRTYRLLSGVQVGMTRQQVHAVLDVRDPLEALPDILVAGRARGMRFVTVGTLLAEQRGRRTRG